MILQKLSSKLAYRISGNDIKRKEKNCPLATKMSYNWKVIISQEIENAIRFRTTPIIRSKFIPLRLKKVITFKKSQHWVFLYILTYS